MADVAATARLRKGPRTGSRTGPPLPREHGAWVMLYGPLLLGLAVGPWASSRLWPAVLLVLTASGVFLAQEALRRAMGRRGTPALRGWAAAYIGVTAVAGLALLLGFHRFDLLWVGAVALAVLALRAVTAKRPPFGMSRPVHTQVSGVFLLTLGAPAGVVVVRDALPPVAGWAWLIAALFFLSGVLHVNLLLAGAKQQPDTLAAVKPRLGRVHLAYHALLLIVVLVAAFTLGPSGGLLLVAFLPAIGRAWFGWERLRPGLPNLKRVGLAEAAYSVWFVIFAAWALVVWHG